MKIVKVSDIKSNPINEQIYNWSGIEELAASIDEVGLLQAITVNQSHMVISGHRRLEAIGLPHRSGPTRMLGLASVSSGVMPPFLYRAE